MADSGEPAFTDEQVKYLEGLPAVRAVHGDRIFYEPWFSRSALQQYAKGVKPGEIFASAGMPESLVGAKRIERSMARWRANRDKILKGTDQKLVIMTPSYGEKDRVIASQAVRIYRLEQELEALREECERLREAAGQTETGTETRTGDGGSDERKP
ncbi:hypothetical protein [Bifidobacterium avesanii]|uniref:Uncharacterized protein n=1 Tax=Bifidobacterium avesanii TaxID=1798157 RepID=A0A7K3TJK6_9BIFI|nr:hypothetical protein [Bifidobacterium avesanii]KAB8287560.1 hypothetical protein DSM100685_1891 [Bifidobacterium avesanii]NEG79307.1 hypothetical protein [Bifidobacterium avesanii]